jgi:hypothetical protein
VMEEAFMAIWFLIRKFWTNGLRLKITSCK